MRLSSAVKSTLRGLKNSLVDYSPGELAVRDATCNSPAMPTSPELAAIVAYYRTPEWPSMLAIIRKRLHTNTNPYHPYKSLVVIDYLLASLNGEAWELLYKELVLEEVRRIDELRHFEAAGPSATEAHLEAATKLCTLAAKLSDRVKLETRVRDERMVGHLSAEQEEAAAAAAAAAAASSQAGPEDPSLPRRFKRKSQEAQDFGAVLQPPPPAVADLLGDFESAGPSVQPSGRTKRLSVELTAPFARTDMLGRSEGHATGAEANPFTPSGGFGWDEQALASPQQPNAGHRPAATPTPLMPGLVAPPPSSRRRSLDSGIPASPLAQPAALGPRPSNPFETE